jgi:hypothetical protein
MADSVKKGVKISEGSCFSILTHEKSLETSQLKRGSTLLVSPNHEKVAHNSWRFMISTKKKLSLLDTLLSLPTDPSGMMRHLLRERRSPPYLILAPLATFLVLVAPTLWYRYQKNLHPLHHEVAYSITSTVALTLILFSFFMSVLFKVLLLDVSSWKIVAASLYSIAGLIPFMIAYYLGNFLASGELSVLRFLATGRIDGPDWFIRIFPTCAKVALGFSFFLFINAVRAITNAKTISALSTSILAIPVLIGSFAASLTISDVFFKNTGVDVYLFFTNLLYPSR